MTFKLGVSWPQYCQSNSHNPRNPGIATTNFEVTLFVASTAPDQVIAREETAMFKWTGNGESVARKRVLDMLPKTAIGIEIGVWKGDFSARILKSAQPKILHLVDPWLVSDAADKSSDAWYGTDKMSQSGMDDICTHVAKRFSSEILTGQVAIHRADSVTALGAMEPASVDYVYVDGDHAYESVVSDLAQAFRVTKANGLICCDDYLLGAWWKDGVVRAVHEMLVAERVTVEFKEETQIVLKKLGPKLAE